MDYPLQPPDGWGGASSASSGFGAGERTASSISDSDRHRVWKSFERRPISRAEARALREVRLSQGIRNGMRGSGAGSSGLAESAMGMQVPELSSDCSVSTSRGTTEDNVSLIGSISGSTSGMSVNTVSSLLHRPVSETIHPKRRGKTPTVDVGNNTSSNVSTSSTAGDDQHRRSRPRSGRPSSPSPENNNVRSPAYSTDHRQSQRQGRDSSPHEKKCFDTGESKLSSSEAALGRNSAIHHSEDGAKSMPESSSPGTIALPWASDLYRDQNDEASAGILIAGGVRSGGEELSPNSKNVPPPKTKSATAPTPGLGLGLGLGVSSESLFRLNGEADTDDVLRAMVRLSSTPGTGTGEVDREKKGSPSHDTSGGAHGKRFTASGSRGNGTEVAAAASRTLWSAEAGKCGVCRGNTPSIKSGQSHTTNAVGNPSPKVEERVLDIEGRTLPSKARARGDRYGPSRVNERSGVTRSSGSVESRNVERSRRKSAPQMGRRWRRRSSHDKAGAAVSGRKELVLSQSQSAPSGIYHRMMQRPLSSNILVGGGSGGGGGDGVGGRMSAESLIQTLSSSGLTRQGSSPSLTVSSASGASQQPPLSTSNVTIGGHGFDLCSESNGGMSDEPRRGIASRSEVAAAGGSRGRSRRQQQQRRPHAITKTAAVHEGPGQSRVNGTGGGQSLKSGSQNKVRNNSRASAGKTSENNSATRGRATERTNLVEKETYTTVGCSDDGVNKTTRELSGIIEGVSYDAAAFVVPPRRHSMANTPLILAETGQPPSPTDDVGQTAASCSSSAAIEKPQRFPSTTGETLVTPTSGGVRACSVGKNPPSLSPDNSLKHRSSTATSGANAVQREGKTATRRIDNRHEIEGGGRTAHGGGRGGNGSAATASHSSRLPGGALPQDNPKAGKSSLHRPRQPADGSTTERNGATGTLATPDVTDMDTIAELQATVTPGAGGGREEGSNGTSRAGGLAIGTAAGRGSTGTKTPGSPAAPDPKAESEEILPGGDVKRLQQGKGVSSNSRSWNSGERTIRSGGGSPNSHGSSASSRSGSSRGDSHTQGSPSTRTKQNIFEDNNSSGLSSRNSAQTDDARTHEDAPCTEVSLPLLDKPKTTVVTSGVRQGARQHSSIAEENQKNAESFGRENVVEPQKLPRISGAGGGRSKAAGTAAEKIDPHAIKVHSRPARVESKDLQTTTEALTTHHLTVDELLKVRIDVLVHTNSNAQQSHYAYNLEV